MGLVLDIAQLPGQDKAWLASQTSNYMAQCPGPEMTSVQRVYIAGHRS